MDTFIQKTNKHSGSIILKKINNKCVWVLLIMFIVIPNMYDGNIVQKRREYKYMYGSS
jgi:hypothetical protein